MSPPVKLALLRFIEACKAITSEQLPEDVRLTFDKVQVGALQPVECEIGPFEEFHMPWTSPEGLAALLDTSPFPVQQIAVEMIRKRGPRIPDDVAERLEKWSRDNTPSRP